MGILSWIILGGLAGWLASMVMKRNDQMGCLVNIAGGVVGALVGGWVFSLFSGLAVTGFNLTSLVIAFVGAGDRVSCVEPDLWQEKIARASTQFGDFNGRAPCRIVAFHHRQRDRAGADYHCYPAAQEP